jgi:glycosyl transferase family 25
MKTNFAEVGCYLSHLKALQTFLDSREDYAVICEDDIRCSNNLSSLVAECYGEYGSDWDILRLCGLHRGTPLNVHRLSGGSYLSVNLTRQTGAGAYVVNPKAATVLLKCLRPMYLPFDHAFDREWFFGLRALFVHPFPVGQQDGHFTSQINLPEKREFSPWIRYWTVFPFRTYTELSRVTLRATQYLRLSLSK